MSDHTENGSRERSGPARIGDLEIDEDIEYQRREWRAQRFAWASILAVVVLSALGVFGHGVASWTSESSPDGLLQVAYERFGRRGGSQSVVVTADASAADDGRWSVEIGQDYLSAVVINSITPEPESTAATAGAVRYTFRQAEQDADLEVTFSITPQGLWRTDGWIRLSEQTSVSVGQFLYP